MYCVFNPEYSMSIADLFTCHLCLPWDTIVQSFYYWMDSSPNRKPSGAFSEPQALPSLVVADCGKSPNTWSSILKRLIKYIEEVDQRYWRDWSNILKRLTKYIAEVDQIYWRGCWNILKRLIKCVEEVQSCCRLQQHASKQMIKYIRSGILCKIK